MSGISDHFVHNFSCHVYFLFPPLDIGEAAEVLHRSFFKHLLGVRICTANEIALAEFGRFLLEVHFWQQILLHHRVALDNSCLVKLAMVDGCTLSTNQSITAATNKGWQY